MENKALKADKFHVWGCAFRNLESLVQAEVAHGIPSKRVLIAGFSQGGAVTLLMLRSRMQVAAVLGMSTWLPLADEQPLISAENQNTPVLMCHGNADQVVSKQDQLKTTTSSSLSALRLICAGEVCIWARKLAKTEGSWGSHRLQDLSWVGAQCRSQGSGGHHRLHHEARFQPLTAACFSFFENFPAVCPIFFCFSLGNLNFPCIVTQCVATSAHFKCAKRQLDAPVKSCTGLSATAAELTSQRKPTEHVLRLLHYPRTSKNMQAYEAPQAAVEEEQEGPQSFATPIEKLQARQNELRCSAATALHLFIYGLLQEFGIAAVDVKKLKENGIHSVEALAHSNKRDLILMKGLSEAKVDKMQKECKLDTM